MRQVVDHVEVQVVDHVGTNGKATRGKTGGLGG
jgi:hypothetical protein